MSTTSTADTTVDPDLVATIRDLLSANGPTARDPETGVRLDRSLWDRLEALGLARLTGAEDEGGSGAGWHESAALLTELAAQAVAAPVGEHDLLAGWLLRTAGLPVDASLRTVAVLDADGTARAVPWLRETDRVVCLSPASDGWTVSDVPAGPVAGAAGTNLAGEPRDALAVDVGELAGGATVPAAVADELRLRAALVRAIQTAGALERCLALVVEHTTTRVQFGRPIARFQAVQHLVADVAAETSLARAAVDAAVSVAASGAGPADLAFPVAVARSCTGHAGSVVVRHCHQLHGAIGTTLEHELHRYTLPVLAWRSEYGSTDHWDRQVATLAADAGADSLWSLITR